MNQELQIWTTIATAVAAIAGIVAASAAAIAAWKSASAAGRIAMVQERAWRPMVSSSVVEITEGETSEPGSRVFTIQLEAVSSGSTTAHGVTVVPTVGLWTDDGPIRWVEVTPRFPFLADLVPNGKGVAAFTCVVPEDFSGDALVGWDVVFRDEAGTITSAQTYSKFEDLKTGLTGFPNRAERAQLETRLDQLFEEFQRLAADPAGG